MGLQRGSLDIRYSSFFLHTNQLSFAQCNSFPLPLQLLLMCLGPICMQINCVTSGNCWKLEKHFRFSAVLHYEYEADHIHLSRGAASQRAFSAITTRLPISLARRRTKTVPASHCSAPIIVGASGCTAATQCHWLVWLCTAKGNCAGDAPSWMWLLSIQKPLYSRYFLPALSSISNAPILTAFIRSHWPNIVKLLWLCRV